MRSEKPAKLSRITLIDTLKKLLRDKEYSEAAEHADAVGWKIAQAKYYSELANEQDFPVFRSQFSETELSVEDSRLWYSLRKCEAHTMCLAQALHSLMDLLAQVVNDSILEEHKQRLDEKDVRFTTVTDKLDKINTADSKAISKAMDDLRNCHEFEYLNAFVNTIKHRSLVNIQLSIRHSAPNPPQVGLWFKQFSYKSHTYQETEAKQIYEGFRQAIVQHVCDVVDKLIHSFS